MNKGLIFFLLLFLAIAERLWFDLGPNVEMIMMVSVLASIYLGRKWGVSLALVALAISDMVIGNTMIMVFTWSAFAVIGGAGGMLSRWQGSKRVLMSGGYGLVSALGFYFYTNFGVWLITPLYEKTFAGLVQSYMMGLPFLRVHAVSSVLLVGAGVAIVELIIRSRFRTRKIRFGTTAAIFKT